MIDHEENLKSKIYIPHLEKYLQKNPNDKEVLYLLGMQGLKSTSPPKPYPINPNIWYSKVVNKGFYGYLKKSASLGFYRAKVALIPVSNWEKYLVQLNKAAKSNDKDALLKIGMQNYNSYFDGKYKEPKYLEQAIVNLDKAQLLGSEKALAALASIYYSAKPNKIK